jgi:hypothetical protein
VPKFLENALRHEAAKKGLRGKHADRYVFGSMNNIGAMRGSKETPKGAAMERKHESDEKKGLAAMKKPPEAAGYNYTRTEIEHHRDEGGKITGHTVKHFPMPTSTKSGAFMDRGEPSTHLFGPKGEAVDGGKSMGAHLKEHLGIGAAPSPKTEEAELEPSEKTGGHEEGEYESDEEGT